MMLVCLILSITYSIITLRLIFTKEVPFGKGITKPESYYSTDGRKYELESTTNL